MGFLNPTFLSTLSFVLCIPILLLSVIPSGGAETAYLGTIVPLITLLDLVTLFIVCRKRDGFRLFRFPFMKPGWESEALKKEIPSILTSRSNLVVQSLISILWIGLTVFAVALIVNSVSSPQSSGSSNWLAKYVVLAIFCGVETVFVWLLLARLEEYRKRVVSQGRNDVQVERGVRARDLEMIQAPTRNTHRHGPLQLTVQLPEVLYDAVSGPIVRDEEIEHAVNSEKLDTIPI